MASDSDPTPDERRERLDRMLRELESISAEPGPYDSPQPATEEEAIRLDQSDEPYVNAEDVWGGAVHRPEEDAFPPSRRAAAPPPPPPPTIVLDEPPHIGLEEDQRVEPVTPRRKRRFWRYLILATVALLILDAVWIAVGLRSIGGVDNRLEEGRAALEAGDYQAASRAFSSALEESGSAAGLTRHPAFLVAENLPGLSSDPRALAAMIGAAEAGSRAGLDAVGAFRAMEAPSGGIAAALYKGGTVRLGAALKGRSYIALLENHLLEARAALGSAPQPRLDALRGALAEATTKVGDASQTVRKVRILLGALPSLFGAETDRSYLLIFQSPSESRGGGGVIDYYGILRARDGDLSLSEVRPADDLPPPVALSPADTPGWFVSQYAGLGALENWGQINSSPSFPVVSRALLTMYENSTGSSLDGVLAMDPLAVQLLTSSTGPIHQRGFNIALTEDNSGRVLMRDVFVHFNNRKEQKDAYVSGVIEQLWEILTSPAARVRNLASSLSEGVSSRHIKMFSTIPRDQRAIVSLGLAGDLESEGPNVQMVFHNNLNEDEIDYFLHRKVNTTVTILPGGDAEVSTTAILRNRVSRRANGNGGQNHMRLSFLLPEGARRASSTGDVASEVGREGDFPVITQDVIVPAGQTARASVTYLLPDAVDTSAGAGELSLTFVPQASAIPDDLELLVTPPSGFEIEEPVGEGLIDALGRFELRGRAEEITTVELSLARQ